MGNNKRCRRRVANSKKQLSNKHLDKRQVADFFFFFPTSGHSQRRQKKKGVLGPSGRMYRHLVLANRYVYLAVHVFFPVCQLIPAGCQSCALSFCRQHLKSGAVSSPTVPSRAPSSTVVDQEQERQRDLGGGVGGGRHWTPNKRPARFLVKLN